MSQRSSSLDLAFGLPDTLAKGLYDSKSLGLLETGGGPALRVDVTGEVAGKVAGLPALAAPTCSFQFFSHSSSSAFSQSSGSISSDPSAVYPPVTVGHYYILFHKKILQMQQW